MNDCEQSSRSGWQVIADYDEAAALVAAALELDPGTEYTRTELSDRAGIPYKTLYLDGTLDAVADLGLLTKREREGEEPVYALAMDGDAYDAARRFDAVPDDPATTEH